MVSAERSASTIWAVIPAGKHLFPFRTEQLSSRGPMVLGGQPHGSVGRRPVFSLPPQRPLTRPLWLRWDLVRGCQGSRAAVSVCVEAAEPPLSLIVFAR